VAPVNLMAVAAEEAEALVVALGLMVALVRLVW
jgi:hypothetical protein